MQNQKEKVIIIGSGAAGLTAAIYAARANLKPLVIEGIQPGGQLTITTDVENYPGYADVVQGPWMMEQMRSQAIKVGARIINDLVVKIDFKENVKTVVLDSDKSLTADTIIIATGAQAKWLGLESENKYNGKGVSACATCDGFFYRNKEVAVVGGGNTAVEEALYLSNICSKVTLIHRRDELRSEKILQDRLFSKKNINIIWNKVVSEILGDENVVAWGGGQSYSDFLSLTDAQGNSNKDCKPISVTEAKRLNIDQKTCFPVGQGLDADYLVIFLVGERFYTQDSNIPLYTLEGGGDESKKTWFAAISNHQVSKYIQNDNITPTDYYMENSTLGMLTPFSIFKYVEPNTGRTFDQYQNGFIPVYVNHLKLKDPETDPFYLVYASPSFYSQQPGAMSAVLIYKINHDYNPQN